VTTGIDLAIVMVEECLGGAVGDSRAITGGGASRIA
jgi:hypothetical protein